MSSAAVEAAVLIAIIVAYTAVMMRWMIHRNRTLRKVVQLLEEAKKKEIAEGNEAQGPTRNVPDE